ncbi:hypothetical protein FHS29_003643 [Saccharothrix tamanrassetensis]|uniref:Acetoacetate decarboxylase n=1 Tax=Saccharothrix tamanrassetensis TaxID=1051531 RepID=A0A841CJ23_9PSEU|nr:acetoacetate decarboxylase family protein [Saccharothrix tamanrassetensis]MBB5957050.1 hypothetical protein [Saccharothrix tamanrassetensis]
MNTDGYPPEPWHLRGDGWATAWLVDSAALPVLPASVTPLALLGKAVVVTAFVDYQPGGVLAYRELLAAVLVRRGARIGLTIPRIWVDSPASRAGARALWGIPKDLARFDLTPAARFTASAHDGDHAIATARLTVPERWCPLRARTTIWQDAPEGLARTPLRVRGRVAPARSSWRIDATGPLGWLRAARPLFGLAITGFHLRFGPRHAPTPRQ